MRYHFTPVRVALIRKPTTVNAREDVGKRENFFTVGGHVN